jgi:hypothetical protein
MQISLNLRFERLASPCVAFFVAGLFLDTFTTALIVNLAGTNAELNPFVRPFLGYFAIPWIGINLLGILGLPRYVIRLHRRGIWDRYLSIILLVMAVLGIWRLSAGVNNLIQLYLGLISK